MGSYINYNPPFSSLKNHLFHQQYITGILIVLGVKNTSMNLAGTLFKSGLAVAGAGIYLFFRRMLKKAKKTEEKIEKTIKSKKKAVSKAVASKKPAAKARQKKLRETSEVIASR